MTDPLSVTASIVGFISLGIQVSEALCRFYTSFKGQDTEIARTVDKLGNLSVIFRSIETALQSRLDDDLTRTIHQSVGNCSDIITELQDEYKHFQAPFPSGIKGTIKASSRRVSYPFRRSTLQKLDEDIQEIRDSLSVALEVLHLGEQKKLQSDITDVKLVLEHIQGSQISSSTRDWLKAPDATLNHNAACAKRYSGTGLWFIEGNGFITWMTQNNSFLWLSGFAGCGKSVLCSTAIQQTYRQQLLRADVGIAFFYFAFSDESKQDESGMLRALLLQLAAQHQECQTDLNNLHLLYTPGTPPVRVLLEQLRRTVQKFQHVHIFLDALDECPQDGGRDRVLEIVREMRQWHLPGLHLLVTSRDELDIRKSLSPSQDEDVVLRNSEIDRDISNFISFQLRTNQHLQKWQNYHDQIQQALSERAQGIFRYVECQIQDLRRCPRTKAHLERCLRSLPRNLDETYERMLCKINEDCVEDARRILKLLCFSSRPLTVAEVIDAYAVDLSEPCRLDCGNRRLDEESLFEICPGLIEVVRTRIGIYGIGEPIVRIAHFSVQEYLVSERMLQQKAAKFSIDILESHTDIACICLIYLLDPGLSQANDSRKEYPLASYAARFWISHYRQSSKSRVLNQIVLKLFKHYERFITWIRIYDPDSLGSFNIEQFMTWIRPNDPDSLRMFDPHVCPSTSALYYSCLFGLTEPAEHLLQNGIDVNSSGGRHGKALIAASWEGHENVVRLLLENGADVNAQGGRYGTALQSACFWGYHSIVIRLLEKGADVNCACGYYGFALQAACFRGHRGIAEELIRRGADVNAEGGEYGTALQAACSGGYLDVVKLLLEFGASVSIENGRYESALQAALSKGHNCIADLLCANGAALEGRPTSFIEWDHDYIFRLRE